MTSTATQSRCFCGQFTPENDSLYCSPHCAHQDALNSLTLGIPHPSSSTFAPLPTLPKGFFTDLPKSHAKRVSTLDDDDALYPASLPSPDFGPFASSKRPFRTQKSTRMATGDHSRNSHHRQRRSITRHTGTNGPQSVPRSITTSIASSIREDRGSKLEWKSHYQQQVHSKRTSKGHATLASADIPVFLVQLLRDVEEMRAKEETADQETHKELDKTMNELVKPPTVNYRMGSFGPVAEGSLPSGMLDSCMTTPRAAAEMPTQDSPVEHCDPRVEFTYRAAQRQFDRCNSVSSYTSGSLMTSAAPDSDARSRSSWISRTTGSSQAGDSPVKPSDPNHPNRAGEALLKNPNVPGLSVPEKRCKYGSAFGMHGVDMEEPVAPTPVVITERGERPSRAKPLVPAPLLIIDVAPAKRTVPSTEPSAPQFKLSSTMEESRLFHRRLESRSKSRLGADSPPTCEELAPLEQVPTANEPEKLEEIRQRSAREETRPSYLAPQTRREGATSGVQTTAAKLLSQHPSSFVTPPRKKSAPAALLRSQWPQLGLSTVPPTRPPTQSPGATVSRDTSPSATAGSPAEARSRHLPGTVVRKTIMGSKTRLPIGGIATPVPRPLTTVLSPGSVASSFARPKSPSNGVPVGRPKTPSNTPQKMLSDGANEHIRVAAGDAGPSVGGQAQGPSISTVLPQAGSLTNSTALQNSGRASTAALPYGSKTSSVTPSAAFSMSLQANAFSSLGSALGTSNTFRAPAYAMSPPTIQKSTRTLHTSASTSSLRSNRSKAPAGREDVAVPSRPTPNAGNELSDEQNEEGGSFRAPKYQKVGPLSEGEATTVSTVQSEQSIESSIEVSERGSVRQHTTSSSAKTGSLYGAPKSRSALLLPGSDIQSTTGSDCQSQAGSESSHPESPSRAQGFTRELALSAKTRERLEAARQRVAELRQARESGLLLSRDGALTGRLSTRVAISERSLSPRSSPLSSPLSAKGSVPNSPSSIEPPTPRAASPSMSSDQSLSPCVSEAPTTPRDGERVLHITSPRDNLVSLVNTMGYVPSILISPSNGDVAPLLTRTKRLGSDASNTSTADLSSSCGTDRSFDEGRSVMCVAEKLAFSTSTPSTAVRMTFAWDTMPQ